jgi:Bacterial antitoxin of type II TA system, VapB
LLYAYGIIICMAFVKKTFNIDAKLLKDAKAACGAATDTETIRQGLQALVRHAAYKHLQTFMGSEPDAQDVPRRREKPSRKRRVA